MLTHEYTPLLTLGVILLGILLWTGRLKLPPRGSSRQTVPGPTPPAPSFGGILISGKTSEQLFKLAHVAARREAEEMISEQFAYRVKQQAHDDLMRPFRPSTEPGEAAGPSA